MPDGKLTKASDPRSHTKRHEEWCVLVRGLIANARRKVNSGLA